MRIVLAIAGASGARYGLRLAEVLVDHELHLVVTAAARTVIRPQTVDHLVDFVAGKVLDQLPQVSHALYQRWGHDGE